MPIMLCSTQLHLLVQESINVSLEMSMAANNHHSTQQYQVKGTVLLYTVEFYLVLPELRIYTLGVVPTVSATSRSPITTATSPSMPQYTASDYVTTTSLPHSDTLVTKSSSHYSSSSTSQHLPTSWKSPIVNCKNAN